MALRMLLTSSFLVLLVSIAGCSGPPAQGSGPTPIPGGEVPPVTRDPGAVEDEKPLQPSPPPGPEGGSAAEPSSSEAPPGRPDGSACLISSECASGVCEGEGCTDDRPGTCAARVRPCTKDLRMYCGCDGQTFNSSGTCPGRRFAARARCAS